MSDAPTARPRLSRPLGHDAATDRLATWANDIRNGSSRAPHALVTVGPDGVGKFKSAFWWASLIHCDQPETCGTTRNANTDPMCRSCKQLTAGSHLDVHVLASDPSDAKRSVGIDEARRLIQTMSLKRSGTAPKVAIIRDAHELTVHAQSALLKLLEEPPGTAIIVLVTHNPAGLLPTIRSRCQVLRFGELTPNTVTDILVADGLEKKSAEAAAEVSGGSAGRAAKCTAEFLEDRGDLIQAFENLRTGRSNESEKFVADIVERRKAGRAGLEELFEWKMSELRRVHGYPADENSAMVEEAATLLNDAEQIHNAIRAIGLNANARIVVRDLLMNIDEPR